MDENIDAESLARKILLEHVGFGLTIKEATEYVKKHDADLIEKYKAIPEASMDEARAREILGNCVNKYDELHSAGIEGYLFGEGKDETACLDGYFTADQLEAIAWWMRNKGH